MIIALIVLSFVVWFFVDWVVKKFDEQDLKTKRLAEKLGYHWNIITDDWKKW
jgi:hypothetical protein